MAPNSKGNGRRGKADGRDHVGGDQGKPHFKYMCVHMIVCVHVDLCLCLCSAVSVCEGMCVCWGCS